MEKKPRKLIVTIPAYNEAHTIGAVVSEILHVLRTAAVLRKYESQVLVVNDGSRDSTAAVARKAGAAVHSLPMNYGLAETFRTEMEQCLRRKADIIVHTDADGQYLANDIPKLVAKLEQGHDLVLGSRFKGKIESMPLVKRMGNVAFSRVISQVTGMRVSDAQTGFRAFTSRVARLSVTSTHTYTQEQIIRAINHQFSVTEVPVYFARRRHGRSRLIKNPVDYALKAWVNILRIYRDYQPIRFFSIFGSLFFGVGSLISIWILYSFFTTGGVGALPRVMLAVLLLSIGVQIYLFGFLADMNKKS